MMIFFSGCQKNWMRKHRLSEHIQSWLSATTQPIESRGRKGLSQETKQLIYDGWHTYSKLTIDR